MRIVLLQLPVVLSDFDRNLSKFINGLTQSLDGQDTIVVLPEMWGCGFDYKNLSVFAEKTDEVNAMIQSAVDDNTLVISTSPEKNQNKVFNTVYAVTKQGVSGKYRKNLLFSPTGEDKYFGIGNDTCVVGFKGTKVGIVLCYEIRFPELFRLTAAQGAEIITVPAVWPEVKKEHWRTLTRARAIENQLFVAGCNCSVMHTARKDMKCGYSVGWSPWGEALTDAGEGEGAFVFDADISQVGGIREQIPSYNDAQRMFEIRRRQLSEK